MFFFSESVDEKEEREELEEEIVEIEDTWVHPKDRPMVTKEERKANQKLVKEQQVILLYRHLISTTFNNCS